MKKTKKRPITLILGIIAIVAMIGFGFAACGGDDDNTGQHTHTYSTTWSSNATQHWKECTGAGCDAKTGTANHAPSNSVCIICSYDNTPPHTHTYSTTWSSNATQHWKECTGAGCDAKTGTVNHTPSNGICTTCGYDNTPPHTHTYSTTWSSNTTQHWKECTGAGCDAKTETASHAPANSVCTTCGYDNTPACTTHNWGWESYVTGSGLRKCQTVSCTVRAGVGDTGQAGGKIIYAVASLFTVTGAGSFTANYLEAAPTNQATGIFWSSNYINVTGATGTAIGTGKANTAAIITAHSGDTVSNNAAKACADYRGGGKNDWFLPSKDELNEMYKARTHLVGITSGFFWSSSQSSVTNAWEQSFGRDGQLYTLKTVRQDVRAVRAF